ncbi:MAG: cysteine desulfurase family protein [Ignavibacteriales bacterium]
MIYLDYAANSPVNKEVLDLFYDTTLKYYANPNSLHKLGLEAKSLLDNATMNIAKNLHISPEEIIYTSGASESNNLAITGICKRYKNVGKHILITPMEHTSIIAPASVMQDEGFEVEMIPILPNGKVDIEGLKKLLRNDTILVSLASVDSEVGIRQPVEEIGKLLKDYPNCHFHTDASQVIGKSSIDFSDVDLVTIAPHKFYGLNGFGALIKKKDVQLRPIILGGKSTTVYRSGTPVLANVLAFDKALELALENLENKIKYVEDLNKYLREELSKYKKVNINSPKDAIPFTLNFSIKGIKAINFTTALEKYEIYVSTKSACCPPNTPSKAVYAMSKDKDMATSSIRVSLSHLTTLDELHEFMKYFDICYKEMVD